MADEDYTFKEFMDRTLEDKIDKIAENVSYMRGKWDEAIPRMKELGLDHSERIGDLEVFQENIKSKVGLIGGIAGLISTGIIEWIVRHFSIK